MAIYNNPYSTSSRSDLDSYRSDRIDNGDTFCALLVIGGVALSIITSSNRWRYLHSSLCGAALQSFNYSISTPRKEFSKKDLFCAAFTGGGAALVSQVATNGMYGLLEKFSIKPSPFFDATIQAVTSAVTSISQHTLKGEMLSDCALAASVLSSLGGSLVTACFGAIPVKTISGLVCRQISSGGISSAVSTLIFNDVWRGPLGQRREWHENLFRLTFTGAAVSGIGAAIWGELPSEVKDRTRQWEKENRKLEKLLAEAAEKEAAYSSTFWENRAKIQHLRGIMEEEKQKAIALHNEFIATGQGERWWKSQQTAAKEAENSYNSQHSLIESQNKALAQAARSAREAAKQQSETESLLRRAVFEERNKAATVESLRTSTITSMPLHDSLEMQRQRLSRARDASYNRDIRQDQERELERLRTEMEKIWLNRL